MALIVCRTRTRPRLVLILIQVFLASEGRELIYCRLERTGHKLQTLSATARLASELVSFDSRSVSLQKVSVEPGKAKTVLLGWHETANVAPSLERCCCFHYPCQTWEVLGGVAVTGRGEADRDETCHRSDASPLHQHSL